MAVVHLPIATITESPLCGNGGMHGNMGISGMLHQCLANKALAHGTFRQQQQPSVGAALLVRNTSE
ncbi:hypothetical protein E4U14_000037 [Claviceps sp. LM454 group G7]|nr:hypothetical protein E4U14_000037 [Claviceps sp. LM454 group G7]